MFVLRIKCISWMHKEESCYAVHVDRVRLCLWTAATNGPIGHPPRWYTSMESSGGMILTGENRRNGEKTCPAFTLPTTNRTWSDSGVNPGLRDEGQATYPLSSARQWRILPYNGISYPKILIEFWFKFSIVGPNKICWIQFSRISVRYNP
jgi:hypothetical protein